MSSSHRLLSFKNYEEKGYYKILNYKPSLCHCLRQPEAWSWKFVDWRYLYCIQWAVWTDIVPVEISIGFAALCVAMLWVIWFGLIQGKSYRLFPISLFLIGTYELWWVKGRLFHRCDLSLPLGFNVGYSHDHSLPDDRPIDELFGKVFNNDRVVLTLFFAAVSMVLLLISAAVFWFCRK